MRTMGSILKLRIDKRYVLHGVLISISFDVDSFIHAESAKGLSP
jgi:hypothetical protein